MKIFLGGTCNGSKWRDTFIKMLDSDINYFNPIVDEWNESAQQNEELQKTLYCDYNLYVITKEMSGVFTIAEVIDDSNKRSYSTVLCIIESDFIDEDGKEDPRFKSLKAVKRLAMYNGVSCFDNLEDTAKYFNTEAKQQLEEPTITPFTYSVDPAKISEHTANTIKIMNNLGLLQIDGN